MISPFNDEQASAIALRNTSILVSAPAGSGKTKILVSRIMSLLIEDHYHVDEFLVLTFTEAAAAEMKQRLLFAIDDELKKDLPKDIYDHLLIQKQKIPYAYITNFHGFCSQLLKKYGYLVSVESQFEILSNPLILKHQVLDECIEQWLTNDQFKEFISLYFNQMNFNNLKTMILELYELIHSIDQVDQFIETMKSDVYEKYINSKNHLDKWQGFDEIKRQLYLSAIKTYNHAIELEHFASVNGINDYFERPDEQTKTNASLPIPSESIYEYCKQILDLFKNEFNGYETFKNVSLRALEKSYNIKWEEDIKPYQKEFTALKSKVSKTYLDMAKRYLIDNEDEFKLALKESLYVIEILLSKNGLVQLFKQSYQQKKKEHNYLDFNDLEQMTIELLQPQYHISELLYGKLKEIMIDEYQDTNQIQETIISLIKDYKQPSIVTFMVGDMKQSIYRFRQADPALFKEKYDTYATDDETMLNTHTRRIDLKFNYRSNKIVLDSVNYIFNQIMDKDVGGLEYLHDTSSHLNYDYLRKEGCKTLDELEEKTLQADTYYQNEHRFDSEVLLVKREENMKLSEGEYEAHLVALRIKELIENSTINQFNGQPRLVEYKDIVVLMRSTTLFLTFKKVFDQYAIPNHIVLSQGYLNATEIVATITMLKAIINQHDNISMLSLLRGPYLFSHFDENLISEIRLQNLEASLYENILSYYESSKDLQVEKFIHTYEDLKTQLKTLCPSEFLLYLYEKSGYDLFVAGLINGSQRKANLDLLVEEFRNVEKDQSIYEIVENYIQLMTHLSASSPAQVISSSDNVVQFMTIHKSKGLEFPIVFVSNMNKSFNKQDSAKRLIADKQLGIAIKPRTFKNVEIGEQLILDQIVEYENPYRQLLSSRQTEEAINEEMRIFYVALTRASQKLIMTGVSDYEQLKRWQEDIIINENNEIYDGKKNQHILMYYNIRKTNTYLDWVGHALMRHPQVYQDWIDQCDQKEIVNRFKEIKKLPSIKAHCFNNTKAAKFNLTYVSIAEIEEKMISKPITLSNQETLQLNFKPLPSFTPYTQTISVTQLQQNTQSILKSNFKPKEGKLLTPTQKGTLIHAFFEHLPLEKKEIHKVIDDLYHAKLYNEIERDVLYEYEDKISSFFNSECFLRMQNATHIEKEKSFSLMDPNTSQIIHGKFDVLCFEPNRITIIDYKTDRIKQETSNYFLKENHRVQMEYYKKIIHQLYPNYTIEAMVYYLEIGKSITL